MAARARRGAEAGTKKPKPKVADSTRTAPKIMDLDKANKALKRVVRENQEWLKEMANR